MARPAHVIDAQHTLGERPPVRVSLMPPEPWTDGQGWGCRTVWSALFDDDKVLIGADACTALHLAEGFVNFMLSEEGFTGFRKDGEPAKLVGLGTPCCAETAAS